MVVAGDTRKAPLIHAYICKLPPGDCGKFSTSGALATSDQSCVELLAVPPLEYVPVAVQPFRSNVVELTTETDHWSFTSSVSPTMPKISTIWPLVNVWLATDARNEVTGIEFE